MKKQYFFIKNLAFPILILLLATISSCKKFVQVPSPTSQLVTSTVFNNDASATSSMLAIYVQMQKNSESYNLAIGNGLLSDELTGYALPGGNNFYYQYFTNNMGATGSFGPWNANGAYKYIYEANAIIQGLQNSSGVSPLVKSQLTGEAYFIRAFWNFNLINCYGDIPYATTLDYTANDQLARTPRVKVLQGVIDDLNSAVGLLNLNYVDATDTATTSERVRPTKSVAAALLARAYLYLGDYNNHDQGSYKKAESQASLVINNNLYSLCPNLSGANSVFLANSSEAIFQLQIPLPATTNTRDGFFFILTGAPSKSGNSNSATISPQLQAAFEAGDQRKANWIGSITTGGQTYYFPYKYKLKSTYDGSEYTMVLRLAEQYLIRAEARAEQKNLTDAAADLNIIRARAGLLPTAATTQSQLLAAILHERQVEMFTEWGARWFDLNRTGNTPAVMGGATGVTAFKGGTWNPDNHQELYPVPVTEIAKDHNLSQNPGY